jgi:hypothetical protein
MSLDMKAAVQTAREQAAQLFADESLPNLALEEIEFDEEKQHWLVTLGYDSPNRVAQDDRSELVSHDRGRNAAQIQDIQDRCQRRSSDRDEYPQSLTCDRPPNLLALHQL